MKRTLLEQARDELQAVYETKAGLQLPYETKDMPMAGTMWLGASVVDAGRSIKARDVGEVEYISPDRWRRILTNAVIQRVEADIDR